MSPPPPRSTPPPRASPPRSTPPPRASPPSTSTGPAKVGAPWPPNLGLSTREYVSRMRAAVVHKHDLEGLVNIKEKTVFLDKVMKNYELDGDDRLEEEVFLRQLRREGGHSPPGYRRAPHSGSHVTLQATPPSASPTCLSARWGQSRPSSRERQQDGSFSARAASRNPTSPTKQQHLVDREVCVKRAESV